MSLLVLESFYAVYAVNKEANVTPAPSPGRFLFDLIGKEVCSDVEGRRVPKVQIGSLVLNGQALSERIISPPLCY